MNSLIMMSSFHTFMLRERGRKPYMVHSSINLMSKEWEALGVLLVIDHLFFSSTSSNSAMKKEVISKEDSIANNPSIGLSLCKNLPPTLDSCTLDFIIQILPFSKE